MPLQTNLEESDLYLKEEGNDALAEFPSEWPDADLRLELDLDGLTRVSAGDVNAARREEGHVDGLIEPAQPFGFARMARALTGVAALALLALASLAALKTLAVRETKATDSDTPNVTVSRPVTSRPPAVDRPTAVSAPVVSAATPSIPAPTASGNRPSVGASVGRRGSRGMPVPAAPPPAARGRSTPPPPTTPDRRAVAAPNTTEPPVNVPVANRSPAPEPDLSPVRPAELPTAPPPRTEAATTGVAPANSASADRAVAPVVAAPGPAPPSAPPAATPAPAAPIVNPTSAIERVLGRYASAFSALDTRAAKAVWPGVNERTLSRAFSSLEKQEFNLGACEIAVTPPRATASCNGTATYLPKVGSRSLRSERRQWTFRLQQTGSEWSIESVDSR